MVGAIYGLDNNGPIRGNDLKKLIITEKKSPNKNDLLAKISKIPPRKHKEPLALLRRVKKTTVFWAPIIKVIPIRKRIWLESPQFYRLCQLTLPNANNAESKKNIMPRPKKTSPCQNGIDPTCVYF
jgi:hypothetical protein